MADILYTYIRTHVCARTQPRTYKCFEKRQKSTILGHGLVNQHFNFLALGHSLDNQQVTKPIF